MVAHKTLVENSIYTELLIFIKPVTFPSCYIGGQQPWTMYNSEDALKHPLPKNRTVGTSMGQRSVETQTNTYTTIKLTVSQATSSKNIV